MGTVAVIGEPGRVSGYALAGAIVLPAGDATDVRRAWRELPASVALVILTESAAQALADDLPGAEPLTVVMPG